MTAPTAPAREDHALAAPHALPAEPVVAYGSGERVVELDEATAIAAPAQTSRKRPR